MTPELKFKETFEVLKEFYDLNQDYSNDLLKEANSTLNEGIHTYFKEKTLLLNEAPIIDDFDSSYAYFAMHPSAVLIMYEGTVDKFFNKSLLNVELSSFKTNVINVKNEMITYLRKYLDENMNNN